MYSYFYLFWQKADVNNKNEKLSKNQLQQFYLRTFWFEESFLLMMEDSVTTSLSVI